MSTALAYVCSLAAAGQRLHAVVCHFITHRNLDVIHCVHMRSDELKISGIVQCCRHWGDCIVILISAHVPIHTGRCY